LDIEDTQSVQAKSQKVPSIVHLAVGDGAASLNLEAGVIPKLGAAYDSAVFESLNL
jgi:hypothetical protein